MNTLIERRSMSKLVCVILIVVAISQFVRAAAYKKSAKALTLYLKDIDAVPDEQTIQRYSEKALQSSNTKR
jgi:hypothetical protein